MSFSADWLALREGADARARDAGLIARLAAWTADRAPRVLDLGSGTGASYRALAPRIGGRWVLSDIDGDLLAVAGQHAGEVNFLGTRQVDLARDLEGLMAEVAPDLVTGSALLDLCSTDWLDRLAAALPEEAALYMALSYDGQESWTPEPPHEARALAAFHAHQEGDKSFGTALGPAAPKHLAGALRARGHDVTLTQSPWRLGPEDRALIEALADGAAGAVAETGQLTSEEIADWRAARRRADAVRIGHVDLLALPA
ncbi:class I SAM-dependent methyltransferase [Roseobacter sp. HKCCA0434]|uniref:class I SAM-dependent methyltransferase n=1 Tax=Roseobacter sp. HKCCA0434 TaxID=3079297 RepID=UPI002905B0F1|nr:class I SAM-dependent methyltransferase [Roseobacter sp. HKCCA0434]